MFSTCQPAFHWLKFITIKLTNQIDYYNDVDCQYHSISKRETFTRGTIAVAVCDLGCCAVVYRSKISREKRKMKYFFAVGLFAVLIAYCNANSTVVAPDTSAAAATSSAAAPSNTTQAAPTTEPATTTAASFGFSAMPSIFILLAAFLVAALNYIFS